MAERTIKHKVFVYSVDSGETDDKGKPLFLERLARRGETVDLRKEDIVKGERHDAFVTEDDEVADEVETLDLSEATIDELVEWLEEESPNVQTVLDASEGDPELAKRLMDAETQASGGEPRKGVVEGLTVIIDRGNQ